MNDPVNPWIPVVPVPWQDGTRQHVGSLGSATNVQLAGTLSYLGHLDTTRNNYGFMQFNIIFCAINLIFFDTMCA